MTWTWQEQNVHDMSPGDRVENAVRLSLAVMEASGIPAPKVVSDSAGGGRFGLYTRNVVHLNVARHRPPVKTPGWSWSFPGWKADLTSFGVTAHEFGHHVDRCRDYPRLVGWSKEPQVSTYGNNRSERFAEAVKVFITNPDLLRVGRPVRYATMIALGLVPVVTGTWREVLERRGAHERLLKAAEVWIRGRVGRVKVAEVS